MCAAVDCFTASTDEERRQRHDGQALGVARTGMLKTMASLKKPRGIDQPERRATAIANANWFRARARQALREGHPDSRLRAGRALVAARLVLERARGEGLLMDQAAGAA